MTNIIDPDNTLKENYGYEPSDLVWFLATEIAHQHVRLAVAKKLGKDTTIIENMIRNKFTLIQRNVESEFRQERVKRYGTGN